LEALHKDWRWHEVASKTLVALPSPHAMPLAMAPPQSEFHAIIRNTHTTHNLYHYKHRPENQLRTAHCKASAALRFSHLAPHGRCTEGGPVRPCGAPVEVAAVECCGAGRLSFMLRLRFRSGLGLCCCTLDTRQPLPEVLPPPGGGPAAARGERGGRGRRRAYGQPQQRGAGQPPSRSGKAARSRRRREVASSSGCTAQRGGVLHRKGHPAVTSPAQRQQGSAHGWPAR